MRTLPFAVKHRCTDSLLILMSAGLLPKDLTEEEVQTLQERFGEDWFTVMGYDEWSTERSKYDSIKKF